jgi:predicted dehydrogenase
MDYLAQPLAFKVRKAARYVRLYGLGRTLIKVEGQKHAAGVGPTSVLCRGALAPRQTVGVIGCGNYAYTHIAYYLTKGFGRIIGGCADIEPNRAASLGARYHIPLRTNSAEEVIGDDRVRTLFIASNHESHAEYAIQALERGKNVYIEKPHVVSEDQLVRLAAAIERSDGRVYLGFNRPFSPFGIAIHDQLAAESGPGMYNWFVAGHVIDPDHWYFKPEEGGRVLGNLCHWTDFVLRLVSNPYPVRIRPTRATKSDCDIAVTFTFGDDTIAAITFSAKGHTFEGVKERFSAHKGNCLITMDDFQTMTIEIGHRKKRMKQFFRDLGHQVNIVNAMADILENRPYDRAAQLSHIWDTGMLFLKTREALERNIEISIGSSYAGWHAR